MYFYPLTLLLVATFLSAAEPAAAWRKGNYHGVDPNSVTCQDVRQIVATYGIEGVKAYAQQNSIHLSAQQIRRAQACLRSR